MLLPQYKTISHAPSTILSVGHGLAAVYYILYVYKSEDPPWYAIQVGSVADSVDAKVQLFLNYARANVQKELNLELFLPQRKKIYAIFKDFYHFLMAVSDIMYNFEAVQPSCAS